MKVYEYKCTACKDQIVTQHYLEGDTSDWGHTFDGDPEFIVEAPCGPLKRVWSAGIQIKTVDWGH
jgi:predicted nucleic acid-binding Zn ribbon protein